MSVSADTLPADADADADAVVLTGATGFVGSVVLEQLLARSTRPVVALVRAPDDAAAAERLRALAAKTWGDPGALPARVTALAGDLDAPGLGRTDTALEALAARAATVVHCAATVRFDLSLEDARRTNVEGTRQVVALAARARELGAAGGLVHVSTAYVHGRTTQLAREDGPPGHPEHRNSYEATKHEGERVARSLGPGVAVVRPSIVVGDGQTGWTSSFNVVYVPLKAAARKLLTVVPGPPDAWVDLVPVDQVAAVIVALALVDGPAPTGTYQAVAGPEAARLQPFADVVCEVLGIPFAACVPAAAQQLGLYAPYADVRSPFELAAARPLGIEPPDITTLVPRLLAFAEAADWGRNPQARPVAWVPDVASAPSPVPPPMGG